MSLAHDPLTQWRRTLAPVIVGGRRTMVLDEGDGPPIVLLHGIPTHSYVWRSAAAVLSLGYRVIAPDLLGFGFSDKPVTADLSPAGQASFIEAVLDRMRIETFALVGHDYGVLVACELLARNPERVHHLTITNTSLRPSDWRGQSAMNPLKLVKTPLLGEMAFALAQPFMLKWAFSIYVSEPDRLDDETMALYWAPFEEGFSRTLLQLFRSPSPTESDFAGWRDALARYQGGSLVAWGALDPTFRLDRGEEIAALLPDARFETFEHSSHFIQVDRPRALARLIAAEVGKKGRKSPLPQPLSRLRERGSGSRQAEQRLSSLGLAPPEFGGGPGREPSPSSSSVPTPSHSHRCALGARVGAALEDAGVGVALDQQCAAP